MIGNGYFLDIFHIRSNSFSSNIVHNRTFLMHHILHVPKITKNLLSVSKFIQDYDVYFEFGTFHYCVKDQETQEVLLKGRLVDGLYKFDLDLQGIKSSFNTSSSSVSTTILVHKSNYVAFVDSISLWHQRLGHISLPIFKKALSTSKISYSDCKDPTELCIACSVGKNHQLPFPTSTSYVTQPLEKIHWMFGFHQLLLYMDTITMFILLNSFSRYT